MGCADVALGSGACDDLGGTDTVRLRERVSENRREREGHEKKVPGKRGIPPCFVLFC
jgi:hypothetical protein